MGVVVAFIALCGCFVLGVGAGSFPQGLTFADYSYMRGKLPCPPLTDLVIPNVTTALAIAQASGQPFFFMDTLWGPPGDMPDGFEAHTFASVPLCVVANAATQAAASSPIGANGIYVTDVGSWVFGSSAQGGTPRVVLPLSDMQGVATSLVVSLNSSAVPGYDSAPAFPVAMT